MSKPAPELTFAFEAALQRDASATPRAQGTVLPVPAEVARAIPVRPDRTRRAEVRIEGLPSYTAKIAGDGRGGYYVPVNRQRRDALDAAHGEHATLRAVLSPDTSKYGLPVPPAFELLLAEDPLAAAYFDELPAGKQRRILFALAAPVRESTRVHRAVRTLEYLAEVRGRVDMRELARRWRLER